MLKQSASIAVCILACSLGAFANKAAQTLSEEDAPVRTVTKLEKAHADRVQGSLGRGRTIEFRDLDRSEHSGKTTVPEPGGLLGFGTVMLMGATLLCRKSTVR